MNIIARPGLTNKTYEAEEQDLTSASYQYFLFITQTGNWIVQRFDLTVTDKISYRYASAFNNSYVKYTDAWTNKATLTYDHFDKVGL